MYSTLLIRSQRRSVFNSLFLRQEWSIQLTPNRFSHRFSLVKNQLENNRLLHYFKNRKNGFSCKVLAVPFAGSLALIGIKAQCSKKPVDHHLKLFEAVKNRDQITLKSLISKGVDINKRHQLGWTALHTAAINKNLKEVELLLKHKADPNMADEYSNFWKVAKENHVEEAIEVLTSREKDFSDTLKKNSNYKGCTALHYAVLSDDDAIIKALLDAGADPTIENYKGHKPKAYAKNNSVAELLRKAETKFIEVKKAKEEEEKKTFPLEQRLKQFIIGQEGAISTVASAVRRIETGWNDDDHPLVFLFLGSSGIGKTELAKRVGAYLHKDSKEGLIRIDMTEYHEKHEVAKFIGSPPGYKGHEEGGQLTEKLRENPNAVVLFDEVEKAHPDVLNILLQLFDEGRLTDGKGQTIECKNAVFIMTSNLGSEVIAKHAIQLRKDADEMKELRIKAGKVVENKKRWNMGRLLGASTSDFADDFEKDSPARITISKKFKSEEVRPILKKHFQKDEFLGRITECVYFLPFTRSEISKLVNKELCMWSKKAEKKHKMSLLWDYNVIDVLANGYDVHYGARSIKNAIKNKVVSQLSMAHERGILKQNSVIKIHAPQADEFGSWTEQSDEDDEVPSLSLQLMNKKNGQFVDIDLKNEENPFDMFE